MDRFCHKCGSELGPNGQCLKCVPAPPPPQPQHPPQQAQNPPQQAQNPPQQPQYPPQQSPYQGQQAPQGQYQQSGASQNMQNIEDAAQQVVPFAKSYLENPKEASRALLHSDNTPLALILVLIHAITATLSFFIPYGKLVKSMEEEFNTTITTSGIDLELSVVGCILGGVFLTVGFVSITFIVLFAMTKVLKQERDLMEIFRLVAANTFPLSASHLLFAPVTLFLDKVYWISILYQFQKYLWVVLILLSVIDLLDISLDGLTPIHFGCIPDFRELCTGRELCVQ